MSGGPAIEASENRDATAPCSSPCAFAGTRWVSSAFVLGMTIAPKNQVASQTRRRSGVKAPNSTTRTATKSRLKKVGAHEANASVPYYQLSILPFVLGVLRYALLVDQGQGAAPEEVILKDRALQVIGLLWLVVFGLGIYAS